MVVVLLQLRRASHSVWPIPAPLGNAAIRTVRNSRRLEEIDFVIIGQQPSRLGMLLMLFGARSAEVSHRAQTLVQIQNQGADLPTRACAACRYRRAQAQAHRQPL